MAFALPACAGEPFVLAANRDEDRRRPTAPLALWHTDAGTPVWAGRDGRDGGTWMGLTPNGRVALLTNVREPGSAQAGQAPVGTRSRGELVTRWLDTASQRVTEALPRFLAELQPAEYNGFNLVLGDLCQGHWHWLNNRPDRVWPGLPTDLQAVTHRRTTGQADWLLAPLAAGVYGLSNAGLDTAWPKTLRLKEALAHALAHSRPGQEPPVNPRPLWHALADPRHAPEAELPTTGVPLDWERALSSIWVHKQPSPQLPAGYGTRSSAVVQAWHPVGQPGPTVLMQERTWGPWAVPQQAPGPWRETRWVVTPPSEIGLSPPESQAMPQ